MRGKQSREELIGFPVDSASGTSIDRCDRTRQGRYYTPQPLADLCYELLLPHMSPRTILLDSSAGHGSFVRDEWLSHSILADIDPLAINRLQEQYAGCRMILRENALTDVSRQKYGLSAADHLVVIGNPPYNDRTSKNKREQKGDQSFRTDADIRKRDLGMSFLLSYAKLRATTICVLHPLSYLIKPTNFAALSSFYRDYRLLDGVVFSSRMFNGTQGTAFPILAALYQRVPEGGSGMHYEQVRNFRFKVLGGEPQPELVCGHLETIDGYIRKYPPRKTDRHDSDIGLYFYNFRDANSLFTSANWTERTDFQKHITVHRSDFYKYAYLSCYKRYFPRHYLFGNFSPLVKRYELESSSFLKAGCILDTVLNHPKVKRFQTDSFRRWIKEEVRNLLKSDNTSKSQKIKEDILRDNKIPANTYEGEIRNYFQQMLTKVSAMA